MMGGTGIEPLTPSLSRRSSTLRRLGESLCSVKVGGEIGTCHASVGNRDPSAPSGRRAAKTWLFRPVRPASAAERGGPAGLQASFAASHAVYALCGAAELSLGARAAVLGTVGDARITRRLMRPPSDKRTHAPAAERSSPCISSMLGAGRGIGSLSMRSDAGSARDGGGVARRLDLSG